METKTRQFLITGVGPLTELEKHRPGEGHGLNQEGGSACVKFRFPIRQSHGGVKYGSGRSPGEGNDYPLQYSCLGNPMDRGVWWASSPSGHKESDMTE